MATLAAHSDEETIVFDMDAVIRELSQPTAAEQLRAMTEDLKTDRTFKERVTKIERTITLGGFGPPAQA